MDSPEDIFYLKQFVKKHPDNQMGWYLLGKQYLLVGKEGKANYCFIQAGDVYDAFEQESHPIAEYQLQMLKAWDKDQKKKKLARRTRALALLLLFIAFFIPANGALINKETQQSIPEIIDDASPFGVVFVPQKELRPIGRVWDTLMSAGREAPLVTLAVRMEEEAGWRKWTGKNKFIMAVEKQDTSSEQLVRMYDRGICDCEPSDREKIGEQFLEWSKQQELHWTLSSALQHYEGKYGKWPQKLDDLIRPYPDNVLSGEKQGMRTMFDRMLTKLKNVQSKETEEKSEQANDKAHQEKQSKSQLIGTNGLLEQQWSKPLEVIVDKATHRLAVIQGNIIVRSYKVGLGGEETPEGSFYISEKVRNPNGSDKGIFGSRGMTLSNTLYAIHGTDEPDSIGKDESLGCIRMKKEDVEELYDMIPLGTIVKIKNGTLPLDSPAPAERFQLEPRQNETNPAKVYKWL